ncbi:Ribosome biogenesis protein BMS1-like protein [Morus notabilis]|uniref:Ribosome biogenesis protein BMS1-like protein n=1 Tax=Morus notabilis TaxID=981085 RepID=W9R3B7_9ROSA|nr:Ribosome biogenesis protein BMS1-like protein [Morus notabilis]
MAADDGGTDQSHKTHRSRLSGASAKKKKVKSDNEKKQNPKAFAFSSSNKAKRLQSRAVEKEQRRLHAPTIDRTYGEPPPFVVLVGKSLLIKSLVKHYTKHNLPEVRGPITIVSGKQRRVQFVECPNDINGMIDAAKFADLALLLIDGSYGFEMETFEFLNILQVHGFPKVMGVLTHLDKFKDAKKLRKTKQRLKHRFWTEIYDGAKLFYLSGLIHGKYPKREIHNLARFVSVMKFHPLSWRAAHPYVLVDRFEDVTSPERVRVNEKCDRNIILYGYLRGCNLKKGTKVHIAGVGDYNLAGVTGLPDPCPLPSAAKKKGLRDKEKLFYAPMSGLGDLLYDKDAIYVDINDHFVQFSNVDENGDITAKGKGDDSGVVMIKNLQKSKFGIDEKLENRFFDVFGRKRNIQSEDLDNGQDTDEAEEQNGKLEPSTMEDDTSDKESGSDEESGFENGSESSDEAAERDAIMESEDDVFDEENDDASEQKTEPKDHLKEHVEYHGGRLRRKVVFGQDLADNNQEDLDEDDNYDAKDQSSSYSSSEDGEDSETEENMGNISRWKESLVERTISRKNANLMQLVYGKSTSRPATTSVDEENGGDEESDGDDFFKIKGEGNKKPGEGFDGDDLDVEDCSKFTNRASLKDWKDDKHIENIRDRFVTGDWSKAAQRNQTSEVNTNGDDDDVYGDFEDLETGEKHDGNRTNDAGKGISHNEDELAIEERRLKKLALRAKFDSRYPFT